MSTRCLRAGEAELHERDEALAAREDLGVVAESGQERRRLVDGCWERGTRRLPESSLFPPSVRRPEDVTGPASAAPAGPVKVRSRSLHRCRRRLHRPLGEDLEQVLLVLLRALEVGLDVDALGRLLGGRLDGRRVERSCRLSAASTPLARTALVPAPVIPMRAFVHLPPSRVSDRGHAAPPRSARRDAGTSCTRRPPFRPPAGMRTSVRISSAPSAVVRRPLKKSSALIVRLPFGPSATISAPSAIMAAG